MSSNQRIKPRAALRRSDAFLSLLAVTLAAPAAGQATNFAGFPHTALNQAQLSVTPGGLVVSNIGSMGLDGVRIDLGSAEALTVHHDFSPLPGSSFSIVGNGTVAGTGATAEVQMSYVPTAAGIEVTPDFTGIGTSNYNLQIFRQGTLVHEELNISGGPGVVLANVSDPIYSWLLGDDG